MRLSDNCQNLLMWKLRFQIDKLGEINSIIINHQIEWKLLENSVERALARNFAKFWLIKDKNWWNEHNKSAKFERKIHKLVDIMWYKLREWAIRWFCCSNSMKGYIIDMKHRIFLQFIHGENVRKIYLDWVWSIWFVYLYSYIRWNCLFWLKSVHRC